VKLVPEMALPTSKKELSEKGASEAEFGGTPGFPWSCFDYLLGSLGVITLWLLVGRAISGDEWARRLF